MREVLAGLAFILCASAHPQESAAIPIEQDPYHKVVYSDQALRVLEVVVPEGKETLDHMHRFDIVTVCIECAATRTRLPGQPWGDIRPRVAGGSLIAEYAGKPAAHAVRNVGSGSYRLVGVENLRASGWTTAASLDDQAGTIPGEASRAFRVYDIRLKPGNASVQHVHTSPTVVVLDSGEVQADNGTDAGARRMAERGEWIIVPAGKRHTVSSQGNGVAHLVEMEVR